MTTRRDLLKHGTLLAGWPALSGLPLAACTAPAGGAAAPAAEPPHSARRLVDEVDVFIGTGGHGHTTPAATLPFGMVQLGPDTGNAVWDDCSGYHAGRRSIMAFSHTHLSGTGVGDLLDAAVMPCVGTVRDGPGSAEDPASGWRAPFVHDDESAAPGHYRVHLRDRDVGVELTATRRVGLHRYDFPPGDGAHLVVDLRHGMQDNPATPTRVPWAELHTVGADTLLGGRTVHQWASGRHGYFALRLSEPFTSCDIVERDVAQPTPANPVARGKALHAVLHLRASPMRRTVLVKVGISAVSAENALRNLEAELPGWDFDATRAAATAAWERELARLTTTVADPAQQRMLTTAHYHCLLAPTLFSDVDGRYRGMDLAIHHDAAREHYTQYSLWDTYRTLHPLYTLAQPSSRLVAFTQSLVDMAAQSADGVPVWPLQGRETGCMSGYHSVVVVAEAAAKGVPGVDYAAAYVHWRRRAMVDDYRGLALYRERGYIPADLEEEGTSKTLEYAYDDWALAAWAAHIGRHDDAALLRARSRNYLNQFDAASGFIRPRLADGRWAEPFDPRALGHGTRWRDFTECNAWQATFLNQHDLATYIERFGGDAAFAAKLDALFDASSDLPADAPPDISGLIGQYAHGNEPSHHIAYLYAWVGQPWKTQRRVRQIMQTLYSDQPDGLAGNEDCGQMSAWLLMSAIGLYPVDPVSGVYVLGSPLVDHARLTLPGGAALVVEAVNNGTQQVYVHAVRWNGRPWPRSWIAHAELAAGGTLRFEMGDAPNLAFGADPGDRPPSLSTSAPGRPAPPPGANGTR